MLPAHVLAEVVGFLRIYELDALLLADARCSDLAHAAASRIRVFDFSAFGVNIYGRKVDVFSDLEGRLTELRFVDETDLANFIPAALRNCVFGRLMSCCKELPDALSEVAHAIIIKGALCLYADLFDNLHDMVEFAASFRSVGKVNIVGTYDFTNSKFKELVDLFDGHGFAQEGTHRFEFFVSFVSRS